MFTEEQERIWSEMTPVEQMAALEGYKWAMRNTQRQAIEAIRGSFGSDQ